MRCTACQFENPDGMKFCGSCGSRLPRTCPSCRRDNPPDFRFCGYCGSPMDAPAPPADPGEADPRAGGSILPQAGADANTAERRQLTVMFCDLAGSTALSSQLDAEEWREVVRLYQEACTEAIEANDGYVAQYLGDGVLAYFGYPRSSEREASRAVHAGLGVVRGVRALGERLEREKGIGLAVRVGIHTGVVVIGEIGAGKRREQLALGETPNLAARLQGLADPDTVLVSGDTYRLVRGEFECEELGAREIAGIPTPVQLHRITRDLTGEMAARRPERTAPLIGRERELEFLGAAWERTQHGDGQVVLITGDPGMGKSSLMHAFARGLGDDVLVLQTRCLPYFRSTAYQPVVELLQRALGCPPTEPPEHKLRCLRGLLERQGLPLDEMMPTFAQVLSLPYDAGGPDGAKTARERKERTRSALLRLLVAASVSRPLLLCVEDLHWADPSTLELLDLLVADLPIRRILALFSHAREFEPPWGRPAHQCVLPLGRLEEPHAAEIVARLTPGKRLPREIVAQILARTDGVPLFVEELTKTVLESGLLEDRGDRWELPGGILPPLAIPSTLHDSLEARLDRLATTKELAQLGAVLGREFSYALLRAVSDVDDAGLTLALESLVEAELLFQQGTPPEATYSFKHALIQEAAYHSLLRGVRQTCHLKAARVLEEFFPDEAEAHPERVAQHYTEAGLAQPAVEAWIRAGRRAVERSDQAEAVAHLRQGLALLPELPAGAERDGRELELRIALGPALTATRGHASNEVRETYLRAFDLSRALGVAEEHLEIMGGLFASYFVRAEVAEAFALAREMRRAAEARGEAGWEGAALVAIGVALLKGGSLEEAREHLERGVERYDPARHFALAHMMGQDFGVVGWSYSAFAHFALGRAGEALARAERAVALARELGHPHSLAFALTFLASVHYFRREPRAALAVADEMEALAERGGFRHWALDAPPMRAWALAALGHADEAREAAERIDADALLRAMGVGPGMHRVRMVAEAFLEAGRPERAEAILANLLEIVVADAPDIWWLSEVHRAHAAALARLGRAAEARTRMEQAVERAREAGTPIFLLRALMDLARLRGGVDDALRAEVEAALRALPEAGPLPEREEGGVLLAEGGDGAVLVVRG